MTSVIIALAVLTALLAIGVPVAFSLAGAGAVGLALLTTFGLATNVLGAIPFNQVSQYSLTVIPMFILLGMFVLRSQVAADLYWLASRATRRLPAGLGFATMATSAGFAAVTGSSVATAATVGKLSIGQMVSYGYNKYFAAGIVAAGGTLGILIPPSIALVIYGTLSQESIGSLLIAGIVPGILSLVASCVVMVSLVYFKPGLIGQPLTEAELAELDMPALEETPEHGVRSRGAMAIGQISILFIIIIGGIYSGIVTANEAASLGAVAAMAFLFIKYRKSLHKGFREFVVALRETVSTTTMLFAIVVGAGIFSYFLVLSRVPVDLTAWVQGLAVPGLLIVIIAIAALIPMGMFLDSLSILVITVPLLHPLITGLGYDGIWLGIMMIKTIEIGLLSPPVGLNGVVVTGTFPGLRLDKVYIGVLPFILADVAIIILLFVFPDIATWLPALGSAA